MKREMLSALAAGLLLLAGQSQGASVDWLLSSHAGYRADGAVLDMGLEKMPGAHVHLPTGRLMVDMPEVSLKGSRGLDLLISRSHGKVNTGYHSLANWDLESPRLVLTTAPSTKLRGDGTADGICTHTGDVQNGVSGGAYTYTATAVGNYAAELSRTTSTSQINQINRSAAQQILLSINNAVNNAVDTTGMSNSTSNKANATAAYNASVSNIAGQLTTYTNNIIASNNWSGIISSRSDAETSMGNVLNGGGGRTVRLYRVGAQGYEVHANVYSLKGSLNQDFFNKYNGIEVVGSNGGTDPLLTGMFKQLAMMYIYFDSLLKVKDTSSSWVTVTTTSIAVYNFESVVDPRKRPLALYLPGQGNRLFYPVADGATTPGFPVKARYVSQDNWFISCGAKGAKGMTAHSPNGVRYYFPESNRENQTGYPSAYKAQSFPGRVTLYASAVENVSRESYEFEYDNIGLGSQPFVGYNNANKLLLTGVKHKLDGAYSAGDSRLLTFTYNKFNAGSYSADYKTGVGDIVLRKISRKRGSAYVDWAVYDYAYGQKPSVNTYNGTTEEQNLKTIQDSESARVYLDRATYVNKDVYKYTYGGPYNITGNFPSVTGDALSSPQGYVWFFSDLTGVVYSRLKSDATLATGYTATWSYQDVAFSTPGYDESKSYRVQSSSYVISGAPSYAVQYGYTAPANDEQVVSAALPLGKTFTYRFYYFAKGINESPLQGYLKSISLGARTTAYSWESSAVIGQKPKAGTAYNDTDVENVGRYRQKAVSISHHGSYGKAVTTFDGYDNPTAITESGLNGSAGISRNLALTYFNADPATVVDGADNWWLLGLKKSVSSGLKLLWTADYDVQGAMQSRTAKGVTTHYKYTETTFGSCLPSLASFEWGNFVSCVANVVFGSYHTGLVYEEKVGSGALVTLFAAYEKGVPQRIRLSNGGEETSQVDDYGNVTAHVNAIGVGGGTLYNDAGEAVTVTPANGLVSYTINRDGFSATTTATGGDKSIDAFDGLGRRLSNTGTSAGKAIYKKSEFDALGRLKLDAYPSFTGGAAGVAYTYDEFDRVLTKTDGTATHTYCYQSCGSVTGAIATVKDSLNAQTVTSSYYALGDFTADLVSNVAQQGSDGSSLTTQTTFEPDWLLPKTSTRGKSSQVYGYYATGQLHTVTDTASGLVTYTYDPAGRPETIKTADNRIETRLYYGLGDLIKSRTLSGGGEQISYDYNLAGNVKRAVAAHAALDIEYDDFGRADKLIQTITLSGQSPRIYSIGYGYNNLGQVTSLTYPMGKVVDYSAQNGFGHVSSIPGIADALTYDAFGSLKSMSAGAVSWGRTYDPAGRLTGISFKTDSACHYDVAYAYDTLNRLNKITDACNRNDNVDSIVRWGTGQVKTVTGGVVSGAMGSAGSFAYTYDHDDIASVTKTAGITPPAVWTYNYKNANASPLLDTVSGTAYGMTYDVLGRITSDGLSSFTYDGFGRMLSQSNAQSNALFYYAADNLRVSAARTAGGATAVTDYVYGLSGELLFEVNTTSQLAKNYVYVAGQLLATIDTYPDTDTDHDGMVDEEELENGLNPLLATDFARDGDGDGLADWQERLWGLNPDNADTDGDGDRDGYEYKRLGLLAALDPAIRPVQSESTQARCAQTKCWLIPVTRLMLR